MPVCLSKNSDQSRQPNGDGRDGEKYDCTRCGPFFLSATLVATLPHSLGDDETRRALLSHAVRKMQRQNRPPFLDTRMVEEILNGSLPSPFQQSRESCALTWNPPQGAGRDHMRKPPRRTNQSSARELPTGSASCSITCLTQGSWVANCRRTPTCQRALAPRSRSTAGGILTSCIEAPLLQEKHSWP